MKKVHFYISIGFHGANYDEVVEFDDDVTEEELYDYLESFVDNNIESSWWYEDE